MARTLTRSNINGISASMLRTVAFPQANPGALLRLVMLPAAGAPGVRNEAAAHRLIASPPTEPAVDGVSDWAARLIGLPDELSEDLYPSDSARSVKLPENRLNEVRSELQAALDLVAAAWPAAATEVAFLVRFARCAAAPMGRMTSGSSAHCPFAIALDWHPGAWPGFLAEALVHECSHIKLRLAMRMQGMTADDGVARYRHPWRSDLRPAEALLVACHAFVAVHRFYVSYGRVDATARSHIPRVEAELAEALAELRRGREHLSSTGIAVATILEAEFERSCTAPDRYRGRSPIDGAPERLVLNPASAASSNALNVEFGAGLRVLRRGLAAVDLAGISSRIDNVECAPLLAPCVGHEDWSAVSRLTWAHEPFAHARGSQVFSVEFATLWLEALESLEGWRIADGGFYTADTHALDPDDCSAPLTPLLAGTGRAQLEHAATALFGRPMRLHGPIVAHRMTTGQGVGVHSDRPATDEETHRVLIFLSRNPRPEAGGHFLLLSGPTAEHCRLVLPLRHNTGLAFALTDYSYHAVTCVNSGTRFSLVLSFRAAHGQGA